MKKYEINCHIHTHPDYVNLVTHVENSLRYNYLKNYLRELSVICNNILPNIHTRRKSAQMTAFFLYCPFSYTSRAGAWLEWDVKMSPGFPAGT